MGKSKLNNSRSSATTKMYSKTNPSCKTNTNIIQKNGIHKFLEHISLCQVSYDKLKKDYLPNLMIP